MSHPEPDEPFEPDEPITSIIIRLHTANVSDAGTDSDIFVALWAGDWTEIDYEYHNDFEKNDTENYALSPEYYSGHQVKDIVQFCILKGDDGGSGWGFGGALLKVNSKDWYTPSFTDNPNWLEDGDIWCAPDSDFPRLEFKPPKIKGLVGEDGLLPDEGPDKDYICKLEAIGGHTPITWKIVDQENDVFIGNPTLKATDETGRKAEFAGHTRSTQLNRDWKGTIFLQDIDGRYSIYDLSMSLIVTLPPPTIRSFYPTFGWPGLTPAAPDPVVVTIESNDEDFDSRSEPDSDHQGSTHFFFQAIDLQFIEAEVVECNRIKATVKVPEGAVSGPIKVWTVFGPDDGVKSSESFTAHPNGFRFVSGFAFSNAEGDNYFPSSFAWERYENTFGTDEMWMQSPVGDKNLVPNPIATFFYFHTKFFVGEGCCHGFSLLALQMRQRIEAPGQFYKSGNAYPLNGYRTLWDLVGQGAPSGRLSQYIQNRQLVVWSDEGIISYMNRILNIPDVAGELCNMNASFALNDMNNAINEALSDPRMIAFAKNCSPFAGHIVVPYNVEPFPATQDIRVYDPNRPAKPEEPDDGNSVFWVNPVSGQWGYKKGGSTWNGLYMFTIPLSEYGHQYHWTLPGLDALLAATQTYMFGSAGGDEDTKIIQVEDKVGKTLYDHQGNVLQNKAAWPEGVMFLPQFETESGRNVFALTKTVPLKFTLKPRSNSAGMFAFTQGPVKALSIEDITVPLRIEFLPKNNFIHSVKVAPDHGSSSAIIRFSNRLSKSESLSYAIRVNTMVAGDPVEFTGTRSAIAVSAKTTPLNVDVEVTHTNRIGQVRILESDEIDVPAGALARFSVSDLEDLDEPNKTPLIFSLDLDGTGQNVKRTMLGQNLKGLSLIVPPRIIVPLPDTDGDHSGPLFEAEFDVSRSKSAFPQVPMKFHTLADSKWSYENGKMKANLERGSHVFRIMAEDDAKHRSFPRTVMVTVPEEGQSPTPLYTLFSQDAKGEPDSDLKLPLGIYVAESPVIGITGEISVDKQLSGLVRNTPKLQGLVLSSELKAAGGQLKLRDNTRSIRYEIWWDEDKPLSGKIHLGLFLIKIPNDVPLGSTFLVSCDGSMISNEEGDKTKHKLNGLPSALRIWGGVKPNTIAIQGPDEVIELKSIKLEVKGIGIPQVPKNVGWWIEIVSGLATVDQDSGKPASAVLTGLRSGLIRIKVVVGTRTAGKIIRIKPAI